ncbi:DUF2795 domain-containing protein [Pseudomonas sp. gcc21]|uniref:DUF2795 domain-containing protein n=1 Tax=Pseudomonas sp. gcc21 TaxID=2726989 RepID=UPI001452A30D|nr:DUF2795 domain-containing protein [Pseudomonas sp. gcc21]QJD59714.1 DUF2795 domain-containing protein [Pseudomonas sp. gcc21]
MTQGAGGQSPTNVSTYLKGIDFPANRDQLIRHAEQNGAEQDVLDDLKQMPDQQYDNMADVMKGYGKVN